MSPIPISICMNRSSSDVGTRTILADGDADLRDIFGRRLVRLRRRNVEANLGCQGSFSTTQVTAKRDRLAVGAYSIGDGSGSHPMDAASFLSWLASM